MTTSAIMTIGRCFSTVGYKPAYEAPKNRPIFDYPRVAERMALATSRAWQFLNHNTVLLQDLDHVIRDGKLDQIGSKLVESGLVPKLYEGRSEDWITFGIRFFSPEEPEYRDYREAEQKVYSTKEGVGRRIYFGISGVEIEGLETLQRLSEDHFRVLLGMIAQNEGEYDFRGIDSIRIDDSPVGSAKLNEKTIWVSKQLLLRLAYDPNQFRTSPHLNE